MATLSIQDFQLLTQEIDMPSEEIVFDSITVTDDPKSIDKLSLFINGLTTNSSFRYGANLYKITKIERGETTQEETKYNIWGVYRGQSELTYGIINMNKR